MNENRREIMENVYLTYLPATKFKTGCLSAQLVTPLRRETAAWNALLPPVLSRGTVRYPDMESLSAAMDRLYGMNLSTTIRKRGERQCVGFVTTVIDDRYAPGGEPLLEPAAQLLGELFLDPVTRGGRFLPEYVESEKTNLIDSIRSIRNDKRDWADRRLLEEMCAAEPYGVSRWGDEQSAAKINNQKLYQYSQRLLAESRLELFYCGSAERRRVEDALLEAFAALPRGVPAELSAPERPAAPSEPRFVTETMDVTQGTLAMGFGGTSNSKLFMNVREKLSLCYYASSLYARSKGILTVSSGIETKDYDRALAEILHQLEAVQRGEWEDWELAAARSAMRASLQSLGDSQGAMENYYLGQAATGQDESPEELLVLLSEVTPERIRAAAQSVKLDTVYFLKGREN